MPQLDQIATIYASQLFWLVVVFALIYFGIGRMMLPKVQGTVDARDQRIANDLAVAERAHAEAARADEDYQAKLSRSRAEAQAAAAKAKAEATAAAERRLKEADVASARQLHEAQTLLAARTAQAETEIDAMAADAVREIVSKVAGIAVDGDTAARAVRSLVQA